VIKRPASVWVWLAAFLALKIYGYWPRIEGQGPDLTGRDWAMLAEVLLLLWGFVAMRRWAFPLLAFDVSLSIVKNWGNVDLIAVLLAIIGLCAVCTLPHWRSMTWRFP